MEKNYYEVYIDDNEKTLNYQLICQCLGRVDTRNFCYTPIFREIITNKIIRPKYDIGKEEVLNDELDTLVYDNTKQKCYQKTTTKKVLTTLRKIAQNNPNGYLTFLEKIEKKQIERILTRVREEDICYV